jgi:predicted enzyme related to lactoylglutathione lyase
MPHLGHFAINADDVPRARRFYEHVFGWKFNAWGPPGFYQIDMGAGAPGAANSPSHQLANLTSLSSKL